MSTQIINDVYMPPKLKQVEVLVMYDIPTGRYVRDRSIDGYLQIKSFVLLKCEISKCVGRNGGIKKKMKRAFPSVCCYSNS